MDKKQGAGRAGRRPAQYSLDVSQRWNARRPTFVPPDSRIDPREFAVEEITRKDAATFLAQHHYLGTCPVAMTCAGLFRKTGVGPAELVGTAVFGQPGSPDAIASRSGMRREEGVELTRFALRDDVAFNGETYAIARAKRILARSYPGISVVLACSDPFPRTDGDGRTVFPGHLGQIYRASSALFAGHGAARIVHVSRDGSVLTDQNFSKIRGDRQGAEAAARRIVAAGAPERKTGESPSEWLERALASPAFRRVRHPGVRVYLLPMNADARRRIETRPNA